MEVALKSPRSLLSGFPPYRKRTWFALRRPHGRRRHYSSGFDLFRPSMPHVWFTSPKSAGTYEATKDPFRRRDSGHSQAIAS